MKSKNTNTHFPGIVRFIINLFQIILFIPIQIIFLPLVVVGLVIGIYKENRNCRKLDVSYSAVQSQQFRWYMHYFQTRPDPLSVAFTKKFPCESHFALWSVMGALIFSQRIFGFTTKLSKVAEPEEANLAATSGSRVIAFDRIMEKYVDEVEQIVLPGIGFDLIALHFTKEKRVKVFEIDQENTIKIKLETMKKAAIKHDWITYIPVDYSSESWVEKLLKAGFDRTKKTLFLWQSVSLYLDAELVQETLNKMADLSADGSVVVQDFYSKAFSSGKYSRVANKQKNIIERMGESWKFGIDMSNNPEAEVEALLGKCGLKMTKYVQFGKKLDFEPFYCIVEAKRSNFILISETEQE